MTDLYEPEPPARPVDSDTTDLISKLEYSSRGTG